MLRFCSSSLPSKPSNALAIRRGNCIPVIYWTPWRRILQRSLKTSSTVWKISLSWSTLKWTVATIITVDMLMGIMASITILNFANRITVKCTIAIIICNTSRATMAVMFRDTCSPRAPILMNTEARFLLSCNVIRLGWANLPF